MIRGIVDQANDVDPDELYQRRCTSNIKRLVTLIKQVSKEAEHANMLPKSLLRDLERVVDKLETQI